MVNTNLDFDMKKLEGKILELWRPLTPYLDESSLRILKFYVLNPREAFTLYKTSKELGLSFSLAYKKGHRLSSLRLLESLADGRFRANVKSCIAAFTHGVISFRYLLDCVKTIWGLEGSSDKGVAGFLALLALGLSARELNVITGNICYFDEAAFHVMRLYKGIVDLKKASLKCSASEGSSSDRFGKEFVNDFSELLGVSEDIIRDALVLAFKGIFKVIPPTIRTSFHNILLIIRDGRFETILVECKVDNCPHYRRSLGLECPLVKREVEVSLRPLYI